MCHVCVMKRVMECVMECVMVMCHGVCHGDVSWSVRAIRTVRVKNSRTVDSSTPEVEVRQTSST